jgi:hypothetical protein
MLLDHLSTPLPVPCLRAGLSISCDGFGMRATPCCVIRLSVVKSWFVVVVWWFCLCRACGPSHRDSRRIVYRLVVPVVGSSHHDRNANRNSLLRLLVVSTEWRLFPLSSSLGHGQCGLDVDVDNGAVLTRLI